ncbi:3-isopropylmalate dehydratase small subunit [Erythrobacter sp. JK5]|uniref:3-isopropylmalate dehydratase small subunit n=1 Tax=Erythrobacter sp. JK5 TaxID=2829500 RepID=UPI001BAAADBD|nr:3-isopropylmalate dehydratase small subunit [Erythrobacter sp. JK5]QUL36993.1 3-isopropylmalate dehydratase small subunit [Erythrobacter sp. JK5]
MSAFPEPLTSIAVPILRDNIDTDTIIPSREMRSTGRTGLADGLFAPWRYTDAVTRTPDPDFALNRPEYRDARILAAGANFGCGSSREHAVWALAEYGIRAIVAESFAPIFRGNCIRNFVLPIALERTAIEALAGREISIDLEAQEVRSDAGDHRFEIDPEAKQMLAEGLDAIDLTLTQASAIENWTAHDRSARPWVYWEATA